MGLFQQLQQHRRGRTCRPRCGYGYWCCWRGCYAAIATVFAAAGSGGRWAMSEKIQPQHLTRKAMLYVRQSSAFQVAHNLESQKLQYAMQARLRDLG